MTIEIIEACLLKQQGGRSEVWESVKKKLSVKKEGQP